MNTEALRYFVDHIADSRSKAMIADNVAYSGIIQESLNGYYKVRLIESDRESQITATSLVPGQNYKKNDSVYLLKAQNQGGDLFQDAYYILGLSAKIEDEYYELSQWNTFSALENCSVTNSKQNTFDDLDKDSISIFNSDTNTKLKALFQDIQETKLFSLSACFTCLPTKILAVPFIKNYGLKIVLTFKSILSNDQEEETKEEKIIQWEAKDFEGIPFNLNQVHQKLLVNLNSLGVNFEEKFLSKLEIDFFQDGLTEDGEVCVEDIVIQVGKKLYNNEDKFSIKLKYLDTSREYFIKDSVNNETVTLESIVYYDNQPMDTEQLKYYWMLKDNKITKESNDYNEISGEGWRLLNVFINEKKIAQDQSVINIRNFTTSSNILTIEETNGYFNQYENIIKCIAIYQGIQVESEELILYNYNYLTVAAEINATNKKTQTSDNKITIETDEIELTGNIKINNNPNANQAQLTGVWKGVGENGSVFYISKEGEIKTLSSFDNVLNLEDSPAYTGKKIIVKYSTNDKDKATNKPINLKNDIFYYSFQDNYIYGQSIQWTYEITGQFEGQKIQEQAQQYIDCTIALAGEGEERKEVYYCWALGLPSAVFTEDPELTPSWSNPTFTWTRRIDIDDNNYCYPPKELRGRIYRYETSRTVVVPKGTPAFEEDLDYTYLSEGAWEHPIVSTFGDNYGVFTPISSAYIDELNTFNKLTSNGTQNALEWVEDENGNPKLYINASWIQTGTLVVGKPDTTPLLEASIHENTVTIGGWQVGEDGLFKETEVKDDQDNIKYTLKYGLNSDSEMDAPSLVEAGDRAMVILYCKKKLIDENGIEIEAEMPFQLLEDGSLYVTAANFSGEKVVLGNMVTLGEEDMDVASFLRATNSSPGTNIGDIKIPEKPISSKNIVIECGGAGGEIGYLTIFGKEFPFFVGNTSMSARYSDSDDFLNVDSYQGSVTGPLGDPDHYISTLFIYNYHILAIHLQPDDLGDAKYITKLGFYTNKANYDSKYDDLAVYASNGDTMPEEENKLESMLSWDTDDAMKVYFDFSNNPFYYNGNDNVTIVIRTSGNNQGWESTGFGIYGKIQIFYRSPEEGQSNE